MIKSIAIGLFVLIIFIAIGFWIAFIKYQPNDKMLTIYWSVNRLEIQTEQSAKYISVDTAISKDTIILKVYTTSALNPFAKKDWRKTIKIDTNIKYVNFNNRTLPVSSFKKRQYY